MKSTIKHYLLKKAKVIATGLISEQFTNKKAFYR